jgi:metal-responsive CopG/Arc/MetJ family transcriptional regulator
MKTAISVPDETFRRVEAAVKRLGMSRSQFFALAAERWLDMLDDDATTAAIDRALAEAADDDHAFTDAAAAALDDEHA